jgi:hypothetical protein
LDLVIGEQEFLVFFDGEYGQGVDRIVDLADAVLRGNERKMLNYF